MDKFSHGIGAYYRRVLRDALRQTPGSIGFNLDTGLAALLSASTALVLRAWWKHELSMSELIDGGFAIAAAILTALAFFFVNLIRAPFRLDSESRIRIDALADQIDARPRLPYVKQALRDSAHEADAALLSPDFPNDLRQPWFVLTFRRIETMLGKSAFWSEIGPIIDEVNSSNIPDKQRFVVLCNQLAGRLRKIASEIDESDLHPDYRLEPVDRGDL